MKQITFFGIIFSFFISGIHLGELLVELLSSSVDSKSFWFSKVRDLGPLSAVKELSFIPLWTLSELETHELQGRASETFITDS